VIVIPMAGLSARFTAAGYDRPKYMLPLGDGYVFDRSVASFSAYFKTLPFLFAFRDVAGTAAFVTERATALGIRTLLLAPLDAPTRGQAETVALGLRRSGAAHDAALTIFNIDTFRPDFRFPVEAGREDSGGYLEVFKGEGENWSFVRPNPADPERVAETAEKRPISRLCCTGLYHFQAAANFFDAFDASVADEGLRGPGGEIYVAPLYNHLIRAGRRIGYHVIPREQVIFCGVPQEYEALRSP